MARPSTRLRVHEAVLALARDGRIATITMEGIAARAGVSKQTLYSSWPSTGAILFDALLARSTDKTGEVLVPDSGDLRGDLEGLAAATIQELTDPTQDALLRAVTAEIQADDDLAAQYRHGLLLPQLAAIAGRFRTAGVSDAEGAAELFVGPILHRWLLRARPFDQDWVVAHVARVVRATA